jgi:hypothetical protein
MGWLEGSGTSHERNVLSLLLAEEPLLVSHADTDADADAVSFPDVAEGI